MAASFAWFHRPYLLIRRREAKAALLQPFEGCPAIGKCHLADLRDKYDPEGVFFGDFDGLS
jgi:hypothetical protein